jgi:hypothetical protein
VEYGVGKTETAVGGPKGLTTLAAPGTTTEGVATPGNVGTETAVVFGNNVSKSISLISDQNEFKLDIDEDYLGNLRNEKEQANELIDDIYKSALKRELTIN